MSRKKRKDKYRVSRSSDENGLLEKLASPLYLSLKGPVQSTAKILNAIVKPVINRIEKIPIATCLREHIPTPIRLALEKDHHTVIDHTLRRFIPQGGAAILAFMILALCQKTVTVEDEERLKTALYSTLVCIVGSSSVGFLEGINKVNDPNPENDIENPKLFYTSPRL
ncbi:MAG: hypothetical protein ABI597_00205 [Gammaproteobacteria bacterium]